MNCTEIIDAIGKLSVVELENRLKQQMGEVALTRKLLTLAKARHRSNRKAKPKVNGHPLPVGEPAF